MTSAKGTKRGAAQATPKAAAKGATPTPLQKKPKANPMIVGVNDAIIQAEMLPEACRTMLIAGAPGCLLTPADQRHKHQELMVKMIGEVLNGIQERMQTTIDADNAKIKEAETTKDGHDCAVKAAAASLQVKAEEVVVKESALDQVSQAVLAAKKTVAEAQMAQTKGDAELVTIENDKQAVEQALYKHVNALKEGDCEATEAKKHSDVLLDFAKQLGFDESLITALPATCMKKPSDRGGFDVMVINEVEAGLNGRVTELNARLSTRTADSAEHAATVEAAQKALHAAQEDHQHAAVGLSVAQAAHREATSIFEAAEATSTAFLPEYTRLTGVRDNHVLELDNFQNYNILCFTTLRDERLNKMEPVVESTQIQD